MTRLHRIAMQRCMAQEALGKLRAAAELFGAESEWDGEPAGLEEWTAKVAEFERWLFEASPIA